MRYLILFVLSFAFNPKILAKEANFNPKIAALDMRYIFENSLAIRGLKKSIDRINESIQKEIYEKDEEFKKIEEALTKDKKNIEEGDKIFESRVEAFNKEVGKTQKIFQERKAKLEKAHSEALGKIHAKTKDIIEKLSKKRGFEIVVPYSQALFVDKKLDITLDVLDILNQELPSVGLDIK